MSLEDKITDDKIAVAVIGLGYAGLPLAVAFAELNLDVYGIDTDVDKLYDLRAKHDPTGSVGDSRLAKCAEWLLPTNSFNVIADCDVIFICVPTPIDIHNEPDMSYVDAACQFMLPWLKKDQLIILQSTIYPGATRYHIKPLLEKSGLRAGVDFHLAYCPERIDPGNRTWGIANTPRISGGITTKCAELAADVLAKVCKEAPVYIVDSAEIAEMAKLLENTFRMVNIALVNELVPLCNTLKIDIWKVIEAAKTKPFGFIPFYPGPGVGGDCIPVVPHFLEWTAEENYLRTDLITTASRINDSMMQRVVDLVRTCLAERGKLLNRSQILILGVAFKPEVSDARNSPALGIIEILDDAGAKVSYYDPHVPTLKSHCLGLYALDSVPLNQAQIENADCVLILTAHKDVDYRTVINYAELVIDTCNACEGIAHIHLEANKIVRLGTPLPNLEV